MVKHLLRRLRKKLHRHQWEENDWCMTEVIEQRCIGCNGHRHRDPCTREWKSGRHPRNRPPSTLLSGEEMECMNGLVSAWNAWVKLESLHPDETEEFRRAIHAAQHILMSRPVQRQFNSEARTSHT